MKVRLYPKGYDPQIATGLPTKDLIKMGIIWTQEDVDRVMKLEKEAVVKEVTFVPRGQWYTKLEE